MTHETKNSLVDAGSAPPSLPASVSPRQFSLHVAWTLVVRILMVANSVLAGIIVARWLGAEGVGQLGVINVSVATVVQLASVGLPSANTYFISKDKKDCPAVAFNSLFLRSSWAARWRAA